MALDLNGVLGISVNTDGLIEAQKALIDLGKTAQDVLPKLSNPKITTPAPSGASGASGSSPLGSASATAAAQKQIQALQDTLTLMYQGLDKGTARAVANFKQLTNATQDETKKLQSLIQAIDSVAASQKAASDAVIKQQKANEASAKAAQNALKAQQSEMEKLNRLHGQALELTKKLNSARVNAEKKAQDEINNLHGKALEMDKAFTERKVKQTQDALDRITRANKKAQDEIDRIHGRALEADRVISERRARQAQDAIDKITRANKKAQEELDRLHGQALEMDKAFTDKKVKQAQSAADKIIRANKKAQDEINKLHGQALAEDKKRSARSSGSISFTADDNLKREIALLQHQQALLKSGVSARDANTIATLKAKGASDALINSYLKQQAETDKLSKKTGGLGGELSKIARNAAAFAFGFSIYNTIGKAFDGIVGGLKTIDRLQVSLQTAMGSAVGARVEFDNLAQQATKLAIPIYDAVKGFADFKIAASGTRLSTEQLRETFNGFLVASAGSNIELEQFQGVMRAVTQILSKGKVQAEELRGQLGDRLPGAFAIMARALGMSMSELDKNLKKGLVDGADAIVKFSAELKKMYEEAAKNRLNTITGAWENLLNQFRQFVIEANKAGASRAIADMLNGIANGVKYLSENLNTIISVLKTFGEILGALALAKVANMLGLAAGGAITAVRSFNLLGAAANALILVFTALMAHPIVAGLTVLGAGLGYLATKAFLATDHMEELNNGFNDTEAALKEVSNQAGIARAIFEDFKNAPDVNLISDRSLEEGARALQVWKDTIEATMQKVTEQMNKTSPLVFSEDEEVAEKAAKDVDNYSFSLKGLQLQLQSANAYLAAFNGQLDSRNRLLKENDTFDGEIKKLERSTQAYKAGKEAREEFEAQEKALKLLRKDSENKSLTLDQVNASTELTAKLKQATAAYLAEARAQDVASAATKEANKALEEQNRLKEKLEADRKSFIEKIQEEREESELALMAFRKGVDIEAASVAVKAKKLQITGALLQYLQDEVELTNKNKKALKDEQEVRKAIDELQEKRIKAQKEVESVRSENTALEETIKLAREGKDLDKAALDATVRRLSLEADILDIQGEQEQAELLRAKARQEVLKSDLEFYKNLQKEAEKAADAINQALTNSIMEAFQNGEKFAKVFKNSLKSLFGTMVLKPVIEFIVKPLGDAFGEAFKTEGKGLGDVFAKSSQGISNMLLKLSDSIASLDLGETLNKFTSSFANLMRSGLSDKLGSAAVAYGVGQTAGNLFANVVGGPFDSKKTGQYAGIGSAVGSIGGPLGAAIGGVVGTLVSGIEGTYKTKVQDLSISIVNGLVDATLLTVRKKKKLTGGGRTRTATDDLEEADEALTLGFKGMFRTIEENAKLFGKSIADFEFTVKESVKGLSDDEIEGKITELFTDLTDQMATNIVPHIEEFRQEGESLIDTFIRITQQTVVVSQALDDIGMNFTLLFSNLSKADSMFERMDIVNSLSEMAGGFDVLTGNLSSFYANFFTEQEKYINVQQKLTEEFAKFGVEGIPTIEMFRNLVSSQDLTTEAGRETFVSLIALSDSLQYLVGTADEAKEAALKLRETNLQDTLDNIVKEFGDLDGAMKEINPEAETLVETWKKSAEGVKTLEDGLNSLFGVKVPTMIEQLQNLIDQKAGLIGARDDLGSAIRESKLSSMVASDRVKYLQKEQNEVKKLFKASPTDALAKKLQSITLDLAKAQMDALNDEQEKLKEIAELKKQEYESQADAIRTQIKGLEEQNAQAQKLRDFGRELLNFVTDLKLGELSNLSPEQQLAVAQSAFAQTIAQAQQGDEYALQKIQEDATAYLEKAVDFFGRATQPYTDVFNSVIGQLEAFGVSLSATNTTNPELESLNKQLTYLETLIVRQDEIAALAYEQSNFELEALQSLVPLFDAAILQKDEELQERRLEAELQLAENKITNELLQAQIIQRAEEVKILTEELKGVKSELESLNSRVALQNAAQG